MDRTQFVMATALVLFGAFLLGWFARWLIGRIAGPSGAELDRLSRLLHKAEADRDAARAALDAARAELDAATEGLNENRKEIEELRDYIERKLARR